MSNTSGGVYLPRLEQPQWGSCLARVGNILGFRVHVLGLRFKCLGFSLSVSRLALGPLVINSIKTKNHGLVQPCDCIRAYWLRTRPCQHRPSVGCGPIQFSFCFIVSCRHEFGSVVLLASGRCFFVSGSSFLEVESYPLTGLPRSIEKAPPRDPTVARCLGSCGGPKRGVGCSYERGTPAPSSRPQACEYLHGYLAHTGTHTGSSLSEARAS